MGGERKPWLVVFLLCWLGYTLHWAPFLVREHFPAVSLAVRQSLDVAPYSGWIEDIFTGPKGGAYINNNPGASIAGAAPLVLASPLMDRAASWNKAHKHWRGVKRELESPPFRKAVDSGQELYMALVTLVTAAGLMAPVSALAAAALGASLARGGVPVRMAAGVALVYAFGTPVFFRTSYLNHNLLVCQLGLIAFLLLWEGRREPPAARRALAAGLLAGFAVLCDMTGLVTAAALAVYAWLRAKDGDGRRRLRPAFLFVLAVLPGILGLLAYQQICFGNPFLPVQQHMPATAPTVRGYRGFDWPSPALMWANFFHPQFGLYVYCPLLAAALAAPFLRRAPYRLPRRETWLILTFFAAMVLFCAANHYSWLQPNTGFRYLVTAVPGLLVLSLQALSALPRWVLGAAAAMSIAENWAIAMTWAPPGEALARVARGGAELPWMVRLSELNLGDLPGAMGWWAALLLACLAAALFTPRGRLALAAVAAGSGTLLVAAGIQWGETLYWERRFPPPGKLVDAGTVRLHVRCGGAGGPAVVFDSGIGAASFEWAWVQPEVAGFTTACVYDRAGYGWSEAGQTPRSSTVIVEELRNALRAAGAAGPYILVGHSFGGTNMRLLAARYPEETAGLVLLEPVTEETARVTTSQKWLMRLVSATAPYGLPRTLRELVTERNLPRDVQPVADALRGRTDAYRAAYAEMESLESSVKEAEGMKPASSLPVTVIAGRADLGGNEGVRRAARRRLETLAARTTLVEPDTDLHYVQIHDPATVVEEVRKLVLASGGRIP
jgi:pimeloyl-ACP methyl ester carboxylesterase